jgi:putative flippase GtrA
LSIITSAVSLVHNAEERHKELGRFLIVGCSGTLLNFVIVTVLLKVAHLPVPIVFLAGNESGMVINFFCHEHWTFAGERHGTSKIRFFRYQLVSAGGIALSTLVSTVVLRVFGVPYPIAFATGVICAVSWNFFMSNRWTWRRVSPELAENIV